MIKEYIGTGKDVETATQMAKAGLNAPVMADVKVEILDMPKKGFLGIGAKPARVKASYDDGVSEKKPKPAKKQAQEKKPVKKNAPKKAEPKKDAPKKEAPKKEAPKKDAPKKEELKNEEPAKDAAYPEKADFEISKKYLADIVKGLNVEDAEIDAEYVDGVIKMEIKCDDYASIIGHHGETLDSIQYLLSLVVKKETNGTARVNVNVGNYREKRGKMLTQLAKKNAGYVLRTGRRYTFEPMNPYDRRIIHTTIQGIEGVESRSIGYNQDRRVVLEPTGGVKHSGGNRRPSQKSVPQPQADRVKKVDRADVPKFGKIEVPNKD